MKIIKVIASMLVILTLFNFIGSNCVLATQGAGTDGKKSNSGLFTNATPSNEVIATTGDGYSSTKNNGGGKVILGIQAVGNAIVATVLGILSVLVNAVIALQVDVMMGQVTTTVEDGKTKFFFTIDRVVFNRIPLLNANYFNTESYEVGDLTFQPNHINTKIKESISQMYHVCKLLALSIGLLTLIYIGIRMAISTVSSDQAKYKKMLVSWVESIILLFVMVYIMSAIIIFSDFLTSLFYQFRCQVLEAQKGGLNVTKEIFEDTVRNKQLTSILTFNGYEVAQWSLIYWCTLFMEIRFLWLYMKRFLMVGFLIVISPLITITYSIDKAGDGKAQAFSAWLNEFILNVLIQPLHALIYLIMVVTANSIASKSPIISLALLMSLGQAEKIVKIIFGMNKTVTLRGVNALGSKEG